jgi:hypothetical protein
MAAGGGKVEMERGNTDGKREREASWLGSLLRAVPFGRGKREKSGGWIGGGGFTRIWKRKKIRGERKKKKKGKGKKSLN